MPDNVPVVCSTLEDAVPTSKLVADKTVPCKELKDMVTVAWLVSVAEEPPPDIVVDAVKVDNAVTDVGPPLDVVGSTSETVVVGRITPCVEVADTVMVVELILGEI